jgi:rhamnogalacturonan acetylesterase
VNNAIAGRSARSFTNEGRFASLANSIKSGDIVVIEFGHNDGGSLTTTDNGRTDCYGAGNEVCTSVTGATVYTYPKYLTDATNLILSKGGKVILSSPTPNNPWEGGSFSYSTPRFTTYAKSVETALGVGFEDHGQYVAKIFKAKGASTVNSYFPKEHTHTSPEGAATVAKAFIKGVLCARSGTALGSYTKNSTASVEGSCI